MTGDGDAIAARDAFQLTPQLGDVAAEALDRLDAQMTGRLHRRDRQGGNPDAGKAQQLLNGAGDCKESARLGEAVQVMLALFLKIIRLDKSGPSIGRQMVADVTAFKRQLGFGGEPGCVSANSEPGCVSARRGFRRLGPPYWC